MIRLIIAVGLCVGAAPAGAQDLPRFDVERHCRQVAGIGGSYSQMIYGGCFDMEQDAYDGLKGIWPALPAQLRAQCLRVASIGGGSYALLQGCIEMETEAATDNAGREFKY